jgi:hypothetical protein
MNATYCGLAESASIPMLIGVPLQGYDEIAIQADGR